MKKHRLKLHALLATLFVFIITGGLGLIAISLKVFDPFEQAFRDFDYTNIYYSKFRKNSNKIDNDIIIVNCGNLQRDSIALMLSKIKDQQPKAVGIDLYFKGRKDILSDSLLKSVLNEMKNPILPYIVNDNDGIVNIKDCPDPYFGNFNEGYSNFIGEDDTAETIRSLKPYILFGNEIYFSFAAAVAIAADSNIYNNLLIRGNKTEIIHYRNAEFRHLDVKELFRIDSSQQVLKNKIVLVGYMGKSISALPDLEDNHFTPMNPRVSGRTFPDMYGVVIHANIISMMLHGDYINLAPNWLTWLIAFVLCYFHMIFFIYMFARHHKWFHFTGKLLQFVSSALLVYISLLLYEHYNYKISIILAIANILLSIDLIYFYEGLALWVAKKMKIKSYFLK